ncbi:thiaminase II, partial [Staphylococcus saprophyticus]|nr:thiaminase II [Staphylococcus saprophyticus]
NEIKQCFLQSTVHERNFFNMSFNEESWSYGGMKNE